MTPQLPSTMAEAVRSAVLRRDLRLFYLFRLLATSYLFTPIFMLFQEDRGLSFLERLVLGAIYSAVIVLAEVPTGVFADRFGRRRSMMLGALAMVCSCVLVFEAHDFWTFAIAESLGALSLALCSGADSAYLYDLLASHDRAKDYPRCESVASAWHLVGSAIAVIGGGFLAAQDLALPYIVTAFVAGAAALVTCLMREVVPEASSRESRRYLGRQTLSALAVVARNGRLAWIVGYSTVVFVLLCSKNYLYQPYLKERGLGTAEIGIVFAGVFLIGAAVAFQTHRLRARFGDDTMVWALLGVLACSFVGLAGAGAGPWMFVLLFVQAVANGIYSPLTKPLLNREITDSSQRAAVLSVESMARRAAMGIFAPLVGLFGQADVMLLCGAVGIGGLVILGLARVRTLAPVDPAP